MKKKTKKHLPLVSVIVPTKNSQDTIKLCLESIKAQSYKNIEIIVVDNNSTDATKEISRKYTARVYNCGPERSAQVNFGVEKSRGKFVYKVDSDFILSRTVVAECVAKANEGYEAVVVHNTPDENVSWLARIRKFEVDMYKYNLQFSSARFVKKSTYRKVGGFSEEITAGEDYDFQNKLNKLGVSSGFIESEAIHLGEPRSLWKHLKKYYMYGKDFVNYSKSDPSCAVQHFRFFRKVYLQNWKKFITQPCLGIAFIAYATLKYFFAAAGYFSANPVRFFTFGIKTLLPPSVNHCQWKEKKHRN